VCVCRGCCSLLVCVCDLLIFYPFQVQEGARKEAQLKREVERKDASRRLAKENRELAQRVLASPRRA